MLIVYEYPKAQDRVVSLTIQDARWSTAATSSKPQPFLLILLRSRPRAIYAAAPWPPTHKGLGGSGVVGGEPDHGQLLTPGGLAWDERLCEIQELVAESDTVANRWTFHGTAGGQRVTIDGMDFYRMADGKIAEEWIALGATDSATL